MCGEFEGDRRRWWFLSGTRNLCSSAPAVGLPPQNLLDSSEFPPTHLGLKGKVDCFEEWNVTGMIDTTSG